MSRLCVSLISLIVLAIAFLICVIPTLNFNFNKENQQEKQQENKTEFIGISIPTDEPCCSAVENCQYTDNFYALLDRSDQGFKSRTLRHLKPYSYGMWQKLGHTYALDTGDSNNMRYLQAYDTYCFFQERELNYTYSFNNIDCDNLSLEMLSAIQTVCSSENCDDVVKFLPWLNWNVLKTFHPASISRRYHNTTKFVIVLARYCSAGISGNLLH